MPYPEYETSQDYLTPRDPVWGYITFLASDPRAHFRESYTKICEIFWGERSRTSIYSGYWSQSRFSCPKGLESHCCFCEAGCV